MKIAAIIAEYNPFHNGHAYQIAQVKESLHVDRIIVIMSGDFVQRGAPAIFDKYTRTRMALAGGADLVLELPAIYACGSAEYFAYGAISILDSLGCVDYLHFGSECGNMECLQDIANILLEEPELYRQSLQKYLKSGLSFPAARIMAIEECSDVSFKDILSQPNNILGIEYLKALNRLHSKITPVTITRKGASFHEQTLSDEAYPSASGLRSLLSQQNNRLPQENLLSSLQSYMPANVWRELSMHSTVPIVEDDFSQALHYKLLITPPKQLCDYQDVTPDLSDRITNLLPEYVSFRQFATLLKTKELTYTRISRCLCHILLDFKKDYYPDFSDRLYNPVDSLYCRILGFRQNSSDLLKTLKLSSKIPMISKLADASSYLHPSAMDILKMDLSSSAIYHIALTSMTKTAFPCEYRQQIIRYLN